MWSTTLGICAAQWLHLDNRSIIKHAIDGHQESNFAIPARKYIWRDAAKFSVIIVPVPLMIYGFVLIKMNEYLKRFTIVLLENSKRALF